MILIYPEPTKSAGRSAEVRRFAVAYNVQFTEGSAVVRDGLPVERREALQRALEALAPNPRPEISVAVSADERTRSVMLTRDLSVTYLATDDVLVVLSVHVRHDFTRVLLDESA
ncbi:hypothetical protein [Streptomyces yerevanensis]|uniref:hypothetical protein n=1 Tax=Streptomyces yerevanensis TaxID=66378 RepID=UPI0012FF2CD4|nr:hypothetical protein [Streptomyces yerevanensis]